MTLSCGVCDRNIDGEYLKAQIVDETVTVPHPEEQLGEVIATAFLCSEGCKTEWADGRVGEVGPPRVILRSKWIEVPEGIL